MRILGPGFLFLSLLFSLTANAQISIGIKGGPDFSKLVNAVQGNDGSGNIGVLKSGTLTQYYGGVFVDIPLDTMSKMFYLRPGVEYIGAGGSMNPQGDYYNANGFQPSTKYLLHYVDVPLQFIFHPGFAWGGPLIGIGPYAGVLVNGTIKPQGSSSESVMIGNKATDNFQQFDFGYAFTIGLALKGGFQFGFDYQHSLIRIVPTAQIQPSETRLATHNAVWGIHVGWEFKL